MHEPIKITPDGFSYRKQKFTDPERLIDYFKKHYKDPIPKAKLPSNEASNKMNVQSTSDSTWGDQGSNQFNRGWDQNQNQNQSQQGNWNQNQNQENHFIEGQGFANQGSQGNWNNNSNSSGYDNESFNNQDRGDRGGRGGRGFDRGGRGFDRGGRGFDRGGRGFDRGGRGRGGFRGRGRGGFNNNRDRDRNIQDNHQDDSKSWTMGGWDQPKDDVPPQGDQSTWGNGNQPPQNQQGWGNSQQDQNQQGWGNSNQPPQNQSQEGGWGR